MRLSSRKKCRRRRSGGRQAGFSWKGFCPPQPALVRKTLVRLVLFPTLHHSARVRIRFIFPNAFVSFADNPCLEFRRRISSALQKTPCACFTSPSLLHFLPRRW